MDAFFHQICSTYIVKSVNAMELIWKERIESALIADSEEKLQRMLDIVTKENEKLGLKINFQKTYVIVANKRPRFWNLM